MDYENIIVFEKLTRTAQEAADQIGCRVSQIVKSIIFKTDDGEPILVAACGSNRIDEKKVELLCGKKLLKADADYVRQVTGYVIGGIPPWGHNTKLQTFIDEDLKQYETIYASAGKDNAVFPLTFKELAAKTKGKVCAVKVDT